MRRSALHQRASRSRAWETIFCLPGSTCCGVRPDHRLVHPATFLVRHEHGTSHIAAPPTPTLPPQVAIVTGRPRHEHLSTLAAAYIDCPPSVTSTPAGPERRRRCRRFPGRRHRITIGVDKHNFLMTKATNIPRTIHKEFHHHHHQPPAAPGRHPQGIINPRTTTLRPSTGAGRLGRPTWLPPSRPGSGRDPHAAQVDLCAADRPHHLCRRRHLEAGRQGAVLRVRSATGCLSSTTLMAPSASTTTMHCTWEFRCGRQLLGTDRHPEIDLLIALGGRFDDQVTGQLDASPRRQGRCMSTSTQPLGKVRRPDAGVARVSRSSSGSCSSPSPGSAGPRPAQPVRRHTRGWRSRPLTFRVRSLVGFLRARFVSRPLREPTPDDYIVAFGVGTPRCRRSQLLELQPSLHMDRLRPRPRSSTLVPDHHQPGIGEGIVSPVDSGYSFRSTGCRAGHFQPASVPVKVAIFNDAYLGIIPAMAGDLHALRGLPLARPARYKMWTEAIGCIGIRVESPRRCSPPSTRPTRSTTGPSSSTSAPTPARRCTRMVPSGKANIDIVVDPALGQPSSVVAADSSPP